MLLRAHTVGHPHGYIRREHASGLVEEADAMVCVHCQFTWRYQPGSGRERGWCFRCGAVTCGATACMTCVHFERRIELIEAGARR